MKILKAFIEIFLDIFYGIGYFIKKNLRSFANILNIACPYLMYLYGFNSNNIGYEVFIPVIIMFIVYFLRALANKLGTGDMVPIPVKRFTEEDEDGEVYIRTDRVQELILYMADLENYLERKGYL